MKKMFNFLFACLFFSFKILAVIFVLLLFYSWYTGDSSRQKIQSVSATQCVSRVSKTMFMNMCDMKINVRTCSINIMQTGFKGLKKLFGLKGSYDRMPVEWLCKKKLVYPRSHIITLDGYSSEIYIHACLPPFIPSDKLFQSQKMQSEKVSCIHPTKRPKDFGIEDWERIEGVDGKLMPVYGIAE